MEEKQVTVDGVTYKVPQPFTVMATQNTIDYEGIFPLPEAQLDRFLMRISLGYTTFDEEVAIIERQSYVHPIEKLEQVASASELQGIQEVVKEVHVEDAVKRFIVSLVEATRHHRAVYLGSSPRGSVALFRTAQARALLDGRDFVLPDDVKALAEPVLAHRVIMTSSARREGATGKSVVNDILESLAVPGALPRLRS
jgi:MoxR-like ATPase